MTKKQQLQEKCRTDLKFLVVNVLGLARWSDGLHGDLVKMLDSEGDRKIVLLPRGHQKSTLISICWVIQQLLRNPNETVGIYSATWKLSKDILHQIKNILKTSHLKDIFGEFQDDRCRWTIEMIDIAQKDHVMTKNASISTGGLDTGKTGSHCSLMIFDDPVTPENTTTSEQIQKTIGSYKDCLPLLDAGGRIVVIGTRYAPGDLYGQLIEDEARSINGHFFETEEARKNWRDYIN